jgi:hypothetical protein
MCSVRSTVELRQVRKLDGTGKALGVVPPELPPPAGARSPGLRVRVRVVTRAAGAWSVGALGRLEIRPGEQVGQTLERLLRSPLSGIERYFGPVSVVLT